MTDNQNHPYALLMDGRLLLVLYISLRLMLLMAYQPLLIDEVERGIGAGGDRLYHYQLAQLSAEGLWPYRDWWSEFPPVWPLLTTAAYQMLGEGVSYGSWSGLLGVVMIASEAGVLVLLRRIGARLHGEATGAALAWVYALMAAPVVFMWWNFDSLVVLALLLGLWLLLIRADTGSALALVAGALVKFVPALLLGAVFRFRSPRQGLRYLAISLLGFGLAYAPLFALNTELSLTSLQAQFSKPSYQTLWAILDGNYQTGNFGTVQSHLRADGLDEVAGNPPVVPGALRLGLAALIGGVVFLRTQRRDDLGLVAFTGITLVIFFLQAQGWSPQWVTQIIPLVLLVYPSRSGVLLCVLLSLAALAEYPVMFIRTTDAGTPGLISGSLWMPWVAVVTLRSLLLIGLAAAFYNTLRQQRETREKKRA